MRNTLTITLLSLFLISTATAQQNGDTPEPNCYQKYVDVFERRGAQEVEDGVHKEIIITIRKGNNAHCYLGKAEVKNGKVVEAYRMFKDKTYETLDYDYKHDDVEFVINNGYTKTKVTKHHEKLVNILFVNHIKPKKKEYMEAPEPDFD